MFQRFKNALDQSIAQEQARHKALSEQRASSPSGSSTPNRRSGSVSRTNSSKDSSARRKTKKSSQDISNGDNGLNPDPAVFEAAFAIGDDETDTRASTPKPPVPDKDVTEDKEASAAAGDRSEDTKEALEGENKGFTPTVTVTDSNGNDAASAPASTPADLPPEVKAKLRKLDKLEKTYPGTLLRTHVCFLVSSTWTY
ncbi:uncharacterized protein BCR38DRAFT_442147 [Pseudomassariella vexata]|uniref:Uncharacterized protein n=1 Tax=Pseudomassariella vexata TaxID=1141098 RepID=A0A1Y2DN11_9PEZI|nr:uncharacterized protein BCR38DRAFT_442147 [Pseudomassariella vexata]ORY60683.1 hypothetical protein BCR38DRAFT_442147 [Pseudomassariella vexata]